MRDQQQRRRLPYRSQSRSRNGGQSDGLLALNASTPHQQQPPEQGLFCGFSQRQRTKRLRKTHKNPPNRLWKSRPNPNARHNANPPPPVKKWKKSIFPTIGNFLSQGNDVKGMSVCLKNKLFSPIPQALLRLLLISFLNPLKNNSRKGMNKTCPLRFEHRCENLGHSPSAFELAAR